MKITEKRTITAHDLRALCIEQNWYTRGDNADYAKILHFADSSEMTVSNIAFIAEDIIEHTPERAFEGLSPTEALTAVMFDIAEKCHTTFSVE